MFLFIKYNDGFITVESYASPQALFDKHGIDPTKELFTGGTAFTTIYNQEVEYGLTDSDTFTINPNGTVEYGYIDSAGNMVEVAIFESKIMRPNDGHKHTRGPKPDMIIENEEKK